MKTANALGLTILTSLLPGHVAMVRPQGVLQHRPNGQPEPTHPISLVTSTC